MREIDPGHCYALSVLDGPGEYVLTFVKRDGDGYPFNRGEHPGTNCQEVLRALIARVRYLDDQIPAPENARILAGLRDVLLAFEERAAKRHGRALHNLGHAIEREPTCTHCGHIQCEGH